MYGQHCGPISVHPIVTIDAEGVALPWGRSLLPYRTGPMGFSLWTIVFNPVEAALSIRRTRGVAYGLILQL